MKKLKYIYIGISLIYLPNLMFGQDLPNQELTDSTQLTKLIHIKNNIETAAISTISSDKFRSSEANPSQSLYGKLAGLTVLQKDQVAWSNNPTFFIRGISSLNNNTPLILVDGFERALSTLTLEEIEQVSVLKDAATLSLYGVRGANGVIDIKTKRGVHGGLEVKVNLQTGIKKPFRLPKYANGYQYAGALNEALTLDGLAPRYNQFALESFKNGTEAELYPSVDWVGETIGDLGSNREISVSFIGGDERIKYYSIVNYVGDEGFLKQTDLNPDYNAQMIWDRLNVRTNLDAKLSKSTNLKLNLLGQVARHDRPSVNYPALFTTIYKVPSAVFPIKTATENWGGNRIHLNPLAELADKGYVTGNDRTLFADLTLSQDLSVWLKGLSTDLTVAYDNRAAYWDGRNKNYLSESLVPVYDNNNLVNINRTTYGQNSALAFSSELGVATILKAFDGKLKYQSAWDNKHNINAFVMYRMEEFAQNGRNNTMRRQSIVSNVGYSQLDKYFMDISLAYAGSSVMSKNNRFQAFPSVSAAWILSKENFMQGNEFVNMLKLRASWGITGSDRFAYELDKQYFLLGATNYFFHINNKSYSGIREGSLPNTDLQYEKSYKSNLGLDANLWKNLNLSADVFHDTRKNVLVSTSSIYSSVIGIGLPQLNQGEVQNYGVELQVNWDKTIGDFQYTLGGNFTFARNRIVNMNEGYQPEEYLKREGNRVGQFYGFESIGYFNNDSDINNSPAQRFSETKIGDIKYKDQNGDNLINEYDERAMGFSTITPEIYYGFNFSARYKGIKLYALLQGVSNYSVVKNMDGYYWTLTNNTNLSEHYLENRWTPENQDALYPRLTTLENKNNFRNNSTWLANGAFLKLRNVDLSYDFPKTWSDKLKAKNLSLLLRGTNLMSLDHIETLDPELMYASYPSFRSFHFGLNLKF
jgi:TonB-linked SusC/RagA family outer membrane protein